jgi:hypothetical protein
MHHVVHTSNLFKLTYYQLCPGTNIISYVYQQQCYCLQVAQEMIPGCQCRPVKPRKGNAAECIERMYTSDGKQRSKMVQ